MECVSGVRERSGVCEWCEGVVAAVLYQLLVCLEPDTLDRTSFL